MSSRNEFVIETPNDFNFNECLRFLSREPEEILHKIESDIFYKLLDIKDTKVLIKVKCESQKLIIKVLNSEVREEHVPFIKGYLTKLFDLNADISKFYEVCKKDKIMHRLSKKYFGLRIIGIPDLFEALSWAIIGQLINLKFAYLVKKKFTEEYGESIEYKGVRYFLFPKASVVANLSTEELNNLQFTKKKAEYIIGIANDIEAGKLKFDGEESAEDVEQKLLNIKGVGKWTAHYVMMKYFHFPSAFPIADVGLHNALKKEMKLAEKPSIDEISRYFQNFKNMEAYTTFYLWRSLI